MLCSHQVVKATSIPSVMSIKLLLMTVLRYHHRFSYLQGHQHLQLQHHQYVVKILLQLLEVEQEMPFQRITVDNQKEEND